MSNLPGNRNIASERCLYTTSYKNGTDESAKKEYMYVLDDYS